METNSSQQLKLEFGISNKDMAILEEVSKQPHHCLKVVDIAGYRGHRCCVKHVRYLVKNVVALEKIIINPVRFWCWPKGMEINYLLENEEANARDHAIQHLKKKVPASCVPVGAQRSAFCQMINFVRLNVSCVPEFIRLAFSQLSCRLSHFETLKLNIKGAVYNQNQAFPALSNLKHLELLMDADYCLSLGRLSSFIKAAPNLHSLVLGLEFGTSNEDTTILEKVSKQPHHCLKVVEIAGYLGHRCCVKHVRYLVKNAVALENIVINPVRFWCCPTGIEADYVLENEEANARDAIQHLKKKVPASVEFVCL